jgi:hypothetical protein
VSASRKRNTLIGLPELGWHISEHTLPFTSLAMLPFRRNRQLATRELSCERFGDAPPARLGHFEGPLARFEGPQISDAYLSEKAFVYRARA